MRLRDLRDILENSVARNIKSYWRNRRNEVIQVCIKEIKVKIPMKKKSIDSPEVDRISIKNGTLPIVGVATIIVDAA